jgi:hypothetical protein
MAGMTAMIAMTSGVARTIVIVETVTVGATAMAMAMATTGTENGHLVRKIEPSRSGPRRTPFRLG